MGGGLRIGTFAGAAVILDWSVALLAGYVILSTLDTSGAAGLPGALVWLAAIFASILIHEFSHASAAAMFKLASKRIVLTFFGGHVEFAHPPRERWHDMVVSAAGPLSNLAAFAVFYFGAQWFAGMGDPTMARNVVIAIPFIAPISAPNDWADAPLLLNFVASFLLINLMLGVFNLLPGFPLDGGRVLSSGLSYVMHPARARIVAGCVGVLVALGLGYVGVQYGFILTLVISLMLLLAAIAEISFARRVLAAERSG